MTTSPRLVAGTLLVAVPAVFMAGFTGLQMSFGYPEVLRRPAGEVLTQFAAGGMDLHIYWYAMFAAALALIAAAISTGLLYWERDRLVAGLSIGFGVLAGLVQGLGLLRWVILIPGLAAHYVAPGTTELQQAMDVAIFDFANQFLGAGVGEHVGYLFTAIWTALVSALLVRDHKILAVAGLVIAAGVAFGVLEAFGVGLAGAVVAIAFSLWAVWALLVGIQVLRGDRKTARVVAQSA
ncbi:DUF4386 family protein [Devosia sp.]|uniref:DUF4386 family protein n=1 Tax=Devosia sp. TaxID=1871048 RepID=UPI003BA93F11